MFLLQPSLLLWRGGCFNLCLMDFVSKLVRTSTGRVLMYDAADNLLANYSLGALCSRSLNRDGLRIMERHGVASIDVLTEKVQYTQIQPAAAVAFTGDIYDLWALLANSFFTSTLPTGTTDDQINLSTVTGQTTTDALNSFGGGESPKTQREVNSGTENILTSDSIMVCTGNCTLVLPDVSGGSFEFLIFAQLTATVSVKGQVGQTVNGAADLILLPGQMVTLRNLLTDLNWSIGD